MIQSLLILFCLAVDFGSGQTTGKDASEESWYSRFGTTLEVCQHGEVKTSSFLSFFEMDNMLGGVCGAKCLPLPETCDSWAASEVNGFPVGCTYFIGVCRGECTYCRGSGSGKACYTNYPNDICTSVSGTSSCSRSNIGLCQNRTDPDDPVCICLDTGQASQNQCVFTVCQ